MSGSERIVLSVLEEKFFGGPVFGHAEHNQISCLVSSSILHNTRIAAHLTPDYGTTLLLDFACI